MKRALELALALFMTLPGSGLDFHTSTAAHRPSGTAERYGRFDYGAESPERVLRNIRLVLTPGIDKQIELAKLLHEQSTPGNKQFHRWLTPDEYARRFGASDSALQKAVAWLQANGMTDIEPSRSNRSVSFSASVSQVSAVFRTPIHKFVMNGSPHYANVSTPSVPSALTDEVMGVIGLTDFGPSPTLAIKPSLATSSDGNVLAPDDLATIYDIKPLYESLIDGAGVTIAIPGMAAISPDDYRAFRTRFGLPQRDYELVNVPGHAPALGPSLYALEATLDLEIADSVARNAKLIYVQSDDVLASLQYVIDNRLADIISYSYAQCERDGDGSLATYYQALAQQASAEGITWVAASGDKGAAGCEQETLSATTGLAVTLPASVPDVTAVGGTNFNDFPGSYWSPTNNSSLGNALGYIPESAWSSTDQTGKGVTGGGGGISAYFDRPSFQKDIGQSSIKRRMVPDVSMIAGVGYLIVYGGSEQLVAGTSAATPLFAGILALTENYLLSQKLLSTPGLGSINPHLYQLSQNVPNAFHDVIAGSNDVACTAGTTDCSSGVIGWPAGTGYDMATGLGSIDAYVFTTNWAAFTAPSQSYVQTATQLSSAANPLTLGAPNSYTALVSSTGSANPSGTVTFTVNDHVLGTAPLVGGKATLPGISAASDYGFVAGSVLIAASYSGDRTFSPSKGTETLIVVSPTYSLSSSATSTTSNSTVVLNLVSSNYGGTVTFTTAVTYSDGALSGIAATAAPSILTNGSHETAVLTISTTSTALHHRRSLPWEYGIPSSLGTLIFAATYRARRKYISAVVMAAATFVALGVMCACGTGSVATQQDAKTSRTCYVTVTAHGSGIVFDPPPITITVKVQ